MGLVGQTAVYSLPGFSDPVSAMTHLLGAGVFAVLSVLLIRRGASRNRSLLLSVFAVASVTQLTLSGVYHLLPRGSGAREVLMRLDHAAIFALIASTFTPIHGILFRGWRRWAPLLAVWTAAVTAICVKSIYFDSIPYSICLLLYLLLGWMGLFTGLLIWRHYGAQAGNYIIYGGVAYTVGACIEFAHQPVVIPGVVGPHELFHVAVLVGMGLFWCYVHSIADGSMPQFKSARLAELAGQ